MVTSLFPSLHPSPEIKNSLLALTAAARARPASTSALHTELSHAYVTVVTSRHFRALATATRPTVHLWKGPLRRRKSAAVAVAARGDATVQAFKHLLFVPLSDCVASHSQEHRGLSGSGGGGIELLVIDLTARTHLGVRLGRFPAATSQMVLESNLPTVQFTEHREFRGARSSHVDGGKLEPPGVVG